MANTISGQIYFISPVQEISTKNGDTLQKREVWLTPIYFDRYTGQPTVGKVEESIRLEFGRDRISQLDSFKVGDHVSVVFELRGRVYQKDGYDNCMTSVDGRSISMLSRTAPSEGTQQIPQQQPQQSAPAYQQQYNQQPPMGVQPAMGAQPMQSPYGQSPFPQGQF